MCQYSGNRIDTQTVSECYVHTPSATARQLLFYTTDCGRLYLPSGSCITPDCSAEYLLIVIRKGTLQAAAGSFCASACKNEAILLECGQPFSLRTDTGCELLYVRFQGANSSAFYHRIVHSFGNAFCVRRSDMLCDYLTLLLSLFRTKDRFLEIAASQAIYSVLIELSSQLTKTNLDEDKKIIMQKALAYIHRHFAEPISVEEISSHIGISSYYFSRMFKQATGASPHEYIVQTRLAHAKHLLCTTTDPIRSVSFQVGYASETGFIAAFTNHVGISPGKYRKLFSP